MERINKIKQYINNKTVITAAVLLCILIAIVTAVRLDTFYGYSMEIDLNQMYGSMVTDEDGSKYITSGGADYVLYGPYMTIDKGYYTVDVDYYADSDCTMDIHSNNYSDYVISENIPLKRHSTHKSFNIRIKDVVGDLEIRTKYSGSGELRINRITITQNTVGIRIGAFTAFIAIILITLCYVFREKIERNKVVIFALLVITFLSCVPAMTIGICPGHDGTFHLLRIEGLAQGLRDGEFPVRMQSTWMEGYGYPVSVYYGDLLFYIPALLRLIGFSVEHAYKIYLFLINFGTTLIAYVCFNKIVKNSRAALWGTAAYIFATYRLTNMYVRVAVGEYSAMLFLPLVFLAVYRIYTDDEKNLRKYMRNAVILALAMTGLVQTHLISVALASLIMAFVCILMIKKTLRKNTLIVYVSAVVMTILLNLFFLVPFMDYSENVSVKILSGSGGNTVGSIQKMGAYISQYFMLYQRAYGNSTINIGDRMAITPGIVLMTALFAGIYFAIKYKDKMIKFMTFMSVIMLWMSSNLFPWNFIVDHVPLMNWISVIQFPWRFLPFAQLFLSLLLCMLFAKAEEEKRERAEPVLLILLIVAATQMFSGVIQQRTYDRKYDTAGLDSFFLVYADYVRTGTNVDYFDGKVHTNNVEITENYTKQGKYAIIKCTAADTEDEAWVEFPIMNYKNYAAYGENGNRLNIVDGDNNVVRVMLPSGYSGMVTVVYEIPRSYRIADICSLIAVIAMIGIVLILNRKQDDKQDNKKGIKESA